MTQFKNNNQSLKSPVHFFSVPARTLVSILIEHIDNIALTKTSGVICRAGTGKWFWVTVPAVTSFVIICRLKGSELGFLLRQR